MRRQGWGDEGIDPYKVRCSRRADRAVRPYKKCGVIFG